jgi:hypothetical protein
MTTPLPLHEIGLACSLLLADYMRLKVNEEIEMNQPGTVRGVLLSCDLSTRNRPYEQKL